MPCRPSRPLTSFWCAMISYCLPNHVEPHTMSQDELQVPPTLRPKLAQMESAVKAAMIKSSQTISKGTAPLLPPPSPHALRKAQSAHSINAAASPPAEQQLAGEYDAVRPTSVSTHRGKSMDSPRTPLLSDTSKNNKEKSKKDKAKDTALSPQRYSDVLEATSSMQLDIEFVKKLRLMLRNESARCVLPEKGGCVSAC